MFKKMRNLHLWIGLITSVLILVESITGLMLSNPQLMGMQAKSAIMERGSQSAPLTNQSSTFTEGQTSVTSNTQSSASSDTRTSDMQSSALQSSASQVGRPTRGSGPNGEVAAKGGADNSLMGIVKGLHAGRLGNLDIKWLIDLSAISMIVLTVTGIYLSVKILRTKKKLSFSS